MNWDHLNTTLGNWISAAAVIGTLFGWLPLVAALIAAIWYCVQIYESKTFQGWLTRRRTARISALEALVTKLKKIKSSRPE